MPVTVELFCEEIEFLESTAKGVLKENFIEDWMVAANGAFATLNVTKASEKQKQILLRRLAGYNPKIVEGRLLINLNKILDL